jgi:hypothetical protein
MGISRGLDGSPHLILHHNNVRDAMVTAGGNYTYTNILTHWTWVWDNALPEPDFFPL